MKNYYEILQVDRHATEKIIKGVYKIHIKAKHPDLFQGEEKLQAEEELKILNEAYETLMDSAKRAEYDAKLDEENDILINDLLEENENLKRQINMRDTYEDEDILRNNVQNISFSEENVKSTEESNMEYLTRLIWKERIAKTIIIAVIVVVSLILINKNLGINLVDAFFEALKNVFFN